jgi:hypothetical protein
MKQGEFSMLIMDKTIVIVARKWRSKWWTIQCMCSKWKRRKDGSCKHERVVLEKIGAAFQGRARIVRNSR